MPDQPQTSSPDETLDALRAQIDALDDSLHDLVMRRADIVARLAASRAKGGTVPLRPGREAMILRRLLARHTGKLPPAAVVRLWREIFAASTAMQGHFSVAICGSVPEDALARLARAHFSEATPIRHHPDAASALGAVASGAASVAVLPMPEEGEATDGAWWTSLDAPRLQVVAGLPVLGPAVPAALVVSALPPDPSDADRSLLRIAGAADRARIGAALDAAGLAPRAILLHRTGEQDLALAVVDGFLRPDDPRLSRLAIGPVVSLGAFSAPMGGE